MTLFIIHEKVRANGEPSHYQNSCYNKFNFDKFAKSFARAILATFGTRFMNPKMGIMSEENDFLRNHQLLKENSSFKNPFLIFIGFHHEKGNDFFGKAGMKFDDKQNLGEILLSAREVMCLLKCSLPMVYRLAERGQIPCVRWKSPGKGRKRTRTMVRFLKKDVFHFIENHYQNT